MSDEEQKHCPDCGRDLEIQLKDEAGYAKFWFLCVGRKSGECEWGSRTFHGPRRDESEIDDIGYDKHRERYREEALEAADEVSQDDFYL